MVDVISNMPLVRAFCGLGYEHDRFDATVNRELTARGRSLRYLEKLRLIHAGVTVVLTIALLAWAITLWQRGAATTGDVVLVCTLGLSILQRHARSRRGAGRRHPARRAPDRGDRDAAACRMNCSDHPEAEPLVKSGAAIAFNNVTFRYPGGLQVFERFSLRIQPGQRVGLVGQSGGGKSTLFALLQRFYDVQHGSITIDGQDISQVTQQSLREAISVVPQDISLFHRSIMENIRYGRPNATDDEVLRAAIAARCDFIDSLPKGLATIVGDRGVKLSGRPAPAHRDRPRLPEGRADPAARRGHRRARLRIRGGDPRGAVAADARAHRDRHRASAGDAAQFRPRRRAAGRPDHRGRSARLA